MSYKQHRSIRQYASKPIDPELLNDILTTGVRASNTGNMQTYSIIVTQDPQRKQALAPLHFNQPMVTQAPVLLTFCADFHRFEQWCHASNAKPGYLNLMGLLTATIDTMLLAQNVAAAAEDQGLGLCFLGTTLYSIQQHCDLLQLPKGVIPLLTMTLGYPAVTPPLTERLPLEAIVHHEQYTQRTDQQIKALYADIESLPANQNFVNENSKETLAQVFTDIRYRPEDYRQFSAAILDTLRKQGFSI